jgi:predicted Zn-dependent protease
VSNLITHLKKLQRKRYNRQELFCIGTTMAEIYPSPQWNFIYGSASINEEIGIYSFARLHPLFPHSAPEILQKILY